MTFTRQRSDGTHETNLLKATNEVLTSEGLTSRDALHIPRSDQKPHPARLTFLPLTKIATFAIATFAITVPTLLPAQARYYSRYNRYGKSRSYHKYSRTSSRKSTSRKSARRATDEITTGVWGWTKGSQTYLRVRPVATTPFVAKVPRHTKLFVWGTFNGWYRVETPDHVFGWVYHQYVNAPEDHKLAKLSHAKAKIACDRSAKQLMYGSPEMLQAYYATYNAPGALRGLEKLGIRVASSSKSRAKAKPVVAKAAPKATTSQKTTKVVSAPPKKAPARVAGTAVIPAAPRLIPVQNPASAQPKSVAMPKVAAKPKPKVAAKQPVKRRSSKTVVAGIAPMKVTGSSSITAEDILRARAAYLGARHKAQPAPPAQLPAKIEETPAGDKEPAVVQPSSTEAFTAPLLPSPLLIKSPSLATHTQLPAPLRGNDGALSAFTIVSLKKAPVKSSVAKSKPLPNRGGSPRDYARHAQKKDFGDAMASQALSYRGMPYIRGAASPRRGFDCSGLVYHLLRQRGYNPPRTAAGLASYGTPVSKSDLKPGDLVLFANTYRRGVSHIGVYCGNGKFVHAANSRSGVRVDKLFGGYYGRKYYGARRVPVKK